MVHNLLEFMRCKHCGAELIAVPEPDAGEWVICCLECGAKNLVEPGLQIVAWRF
jgi:DNA-directed RNA polymerase subunit RPC12/RpoP